MARHEEKKAKLLGYQADLTWTAGQERWLSGYPHAMYVVKYGLTTEIRTATPAADQLATRGNNSRCSSTR